jgi:type IV pilus assembly protein PilP
MRRHLIALPAGLIMLLWLSGGCGLAEVWAAEKTGGPNSPPAVAATAGGPGEKPAPAAAAPPAAADYRYRSAGKSDPFRPFLETDPAVIKKREEDALKKAVRLKAAKAVPISPLQQMDIGHFRLVGIIGSDQSRSAVVIDAATKKFYPLSVGTLIGLNDGRVTAIEPDRVIITERVETKGKKAQTRRVTMGLYKEEERRP